jgi:hypothetical protein
VIREFIETLPLEIRAREALLKLSPRSYGGLAAALVERYAPKPGG